MGRRITTESRLRWLDVLLKRKPRSDCNGIREKLSVAYQLGGAKGLDVYLVHLELTHPGLLLAERAIVQDFDKALQGLFETLAQEKLLLQQQQERSRELLTWEQRRELINRRETVARLEVALKGKPPQSCQFQLTPAQRMSMAFDRLQASNVAT